MKLGRPGTGGSEAEMGAPWVRDPAPFAPSRSFPASGDYRAEAAPAGHVGGGWDPERLLSTGLSVPLFVDPHKRSTNFPPSGKRYFSSSIDAPQGRLIKNVFYIFKIYIK